MKHLTAVILLSMGLSGTAAVALENPEMVINFTQKTADGSFHDESGNGHNASCFTLNIVSACIPSFNAVRLNVDTFSWGWLEVPDSPLLNPETEFSVAAWIIPQNRGLGSSKIVGKVTADFDGGFVLGLDRNRINPSKFAVFAEVWDSSGKRYHSQRGDVVANEATHVALTWKTNGAMRTFVNGVMVASVKTGANPVGKNTNPLRIGIAPWDTRAFAFDGYITKLEYFNSALTKAQILALMNPKSVP